MRLHLGRGDRGYSYLDGLAEAMSPDEAQFENLRLIAPIQAGANETLEASVARFRAAVEAWCGESSPRDDLAILAIEIGAAA